MNTPPPIDLSKLKSILGNAKTIMNKVESNDYQTGNINPKALTEEGVMELQSEGVTAPSNRPMSYNEETIKNSKLPPIIKKAMLENPIPQLTNPNYTFSLDDVSELNDKPMGHPKTPNTKIRQKNISESYNNDTITINKQELNELIENIVNKKLLEFLTKSYNKSITEQTVKSTIQTLIKEGKLVPKKKTI